MALFGKKKKEEEVLQQEYANTINEQFNVHEIDYGPGYAYLPKQSVDDKLRELAKMDHVQFVFYLSKMYQLKGCSVKFTPVVDNYGVDLITQLHEHTTGVRCVLTDKVLTRQIIDDTLLAMRYYPIDDVAIVTNSYFDADAIKYQKNNALVALVDRNILIDNFLKYKPAPTPKPPEEKEEESPKEEE